MPLKGIFKPVYWGKFGAHVSSASRHLWMASASAVTLFANIPPSPSAVVMSRRKWLAAIENSSNCFPVILGFWWWGVVRRSCFHCFTFSFCKVAQNYQIVRALFFLTFQRNILVVFSVDDVHKLQPRGFQWTSASAGGFRVTNDWKWCTFPTGTCTRKKKPCFHNRLCCLDCSQSTSHRRIPACIWRLDCPAPALAVLLWSKSCTTHDLSRLPGRRRRVRNYVRVHSGRCFSESLEQIFVDELMSVSYVTVIAELL